MCTRRVLLCTFALAGWAGAVSFGEEEVQRLPASQATRVADVGELVSDRIRFLGLTAPGPQQAVMWARDFRYHAFMRMPEGNIEYVCVHVGADIAVRDKVLYWVKQPLP